MQVILDTPLALAMCLKIAILCSESLTFCELCTSSLSVSGILHQGSHQSSLIQVTRFSLRLVDPTARRVRGPVLSLPRSLVASTFVLGLSRLSCLIYSFFFLTRLKYFYKIIKYFFICYQIGFCFLCFNI